MHVGWNPGVFVSHWHVRRGSWACCAVVLCGRWADGHCRPAYSLWPEAHLICLVLCLLCGDLISSASKSMCPLCRLRQRLLRRVCGRAAGRRQPGSCRRLGLRGGVVYGGGARLAGRGAGPGRHPGARGAAPGARAGRRGADCLTCRRHALADFAGVLQFLMEVAYWAMCRAAHLNPSCGCTLQ